MDKSETKPADAAAPVAPTVTAVSEAPVAEPTAAAPVAVAPVATEPADAPAKEAEKDAPAPEATPIAQLWKTAQDSGHPEIWGVTLADPESHIPTQIILQKYLNANDGDLVKAKDQLTKTLDWRAKFKPLELVKKTYSKAKFEGLGFVTIYTADGDLATEPEGREVFTWNIYGGVKSIEETFGKTDE